MSVPLSKTTCVFHLKRPAVARCPKCGSFYCGECITEHEGKLTCASCLAGEHKEKPAKRRAAWLSPAPLLQIACGLAFCWLLYYLIAQVLLSVPADFHDGTVWE